MELDRIEICNFRSIKEQTIKFDHNCLILLGKNDAGKSNILKAIAAVFDEYEVSAKDKRKRINNEKIERHYVRAVFKLSDSDFADILERFEAQYINSECIKFKNNRTLLDYIKEFFDSITMRIDIGNDEVPFLDYWLCPKNGFDLTKEVFLNGNQLTNTQTHTKFDLRQSIFSIAKGLYDENPYKCHYWQYSDEYLLPSSIDINKFKNNTVFCAPLKNIFELCNRADIKQEFDDAMEQDNDLGNILEQVSDEVTKVFGDIWKDFKNTSIELRQNGSEITIKLVDKIKYACEDRSDGAKKLISILLMLSTQFRAKKIGERDIILIDEPDQSLYPSSTRYLRDELLKIADSAKVIYSTHSPYMIDSNCIDRHLIVKRNKDISTAEKQDENAPFSDDELLKQAIGTSIFECLKDKNIIFEGWLDRELFRKHCEFNKLTKTFDSIGKVYLQGISSVETLVQLLILANKSFVIVADADKPSANKRKEFAKNYHEFSNSWLAYADIVKNIETMEDFIQTNYIAEHIKKEFPNFSYDDKKSAIENIKTATNDDKEKTQNIKKSLIANLKKDDIKPEYGDFIKSLKKKLDSL